MCFGGKSPAPAPMPQLPPPPPPQPMPQMEPIVIESPEYPEPTPPPPAPTATAQKLAIKGEEDPKKAEARNKRTANRKGVGALRIDLGSTPSSSGLSIPK